MTTALVLGATGHIGAHVVRALLAGGYTVRAASRSGRHAAVLDGLDVERIACDIEDAQQLRRAVDGCELVFHCAGYYPRFNDYRTRAIEQGLRQTRQVFDVLSRSAARRIVYTSSMATIAPWDGRRLAIEADAEPWPLRQWRPLYAAVKTAMEHEARAYAARGGPVVIVNPSICIGEYDAHTFSGRLVLLFARGRLPWHLDAPINVVYTGDVGIGHVRAAERGRTGERYLLAHRNLSVGEFARLVARAAGVAPPRWRVPQLLLAAAGAAAELASWPTGRGGVPDIADLHERMRLERDGRRDEGVGGRLMRVDVPARLDVEPDAHLRPAARPHLPRLMAGGDAHHLVAGRRRVGRCGGNG